MQQGENLTNLLASAVLIVASTALGLIGVHLASRRALAWAQDMKRIRESRQQQIVTVLHVI